MQTLLGQSEGEKSRAERLFATVDSHLKMLARRSNNHNYDSHNSVSGLNNSNSHTVSVVRTQSAEQVTLNAGMDNATSSNSGAPFMRGGARILRKPTAESTLNTSTITKKANLETQTSQTASAFTDRGQVNDTYSVDRIQMSMTAAGGITKYASAGSGAAVPSQHSEISVHGSRNTKPTNKESKGHITSLDQASPRALFHMLLTLEDEYDTLERERLDCLALRESTMTSKQVTRKLDDRQRELRRQLDRKAIQVDKILKVLEPKLQNQAGGGLQNVPDMISKGLKAAKSASSNHGHGDDICVQEGLMSPGPSHAGYHEGSNFVLQSHQHGQGDSSGEGYSPETRDRIGGDGRRVGGRKKTNGSRLSPEQLKYDKYHNVKLLREMKDFNRFLKNTGSF